MKKPIYPNLRIKRYCFLKHTNASSILTDAMEKRLNSLGPKGRIVWSLSIEQILYIKDKYGYTVEPYIYKIKTQKHFFNKKKQPAIIKEIMRAAYDDKKFIAKPLKKQDLQILDSNEIYYEPLKFLIKTL